MAFYNSIGGDSNGEVEDLQIEFEDDAQVHLPDAGFITGTVGTYLTITDDIRNKYQYVTLIARKSYQSMISHVYLDNTEMVLNTPYVIGNYANIIAKPFSDDAQALFKGGGATVEFHN